jgi:uncharacterized membrane protein
MALLLLGLLLFIGAHSISIASTAIRDRLVARLGEGPWKGLYSLVSLAGLVAIVWGYGSARQDPTILYAPPTALRHAAILLLLPVFPLFVATYLPGRIQTAVRHPTLVATQLWGGAHLLANGTLADVVLFGSFAGWAFLDMRSMRHRIPRAIAKAPPSKANDAIAVSVGLAIYVAIVFWLHAWLIGVPVFTG